MHVLCLERDTEESKSARERLVKLMGCLTACERQNPVMIAVFRFQNASWTLTFPSLSSLPLLPPNTYTPLLPSKSLPSRRILHYLALSNPHHHG